MLFSQHEGAFLLFKKGVLESLVFNRARALFFLPLLLWISAGEATVGTDRRGARSSAGRAAVPPRAVLRREGLSRFHKCPVRRRGSRLGSKMSSWVQLLLALLAACLRFGVAEVGLHHSRTFELLEMFVFSGRTTVNLVLVSTNSVSQQNMTCFIYSAPLKGYKIGYNRVC